MDSKIVEFLTKQSDQPSMWKPKSGEYPEGQDVGYVSTLQLAKEVVGPNGTTGMVNSALYKLEKEGKVLKKSNANGGEPRWTLAQS